MSSDLTILRDLTPLIGTITTIWTGYKLISEQVKKNRKVKWIDDFRSESAKFITLTTAIHGEWTNDRLFEVTGSLNLLVLFLEESDNKVHKQLITQLNDLQNFTLNCDLNQMQTFYTLRGKLQQVKKLTCDVIAIEKQSL